jgi:flap endonuclease-1
MGTKITDLLQTKELSIEDLSGKTIAVDAFNQLYMFLASIRQPDGALLTDSHGNVTSHLNGLFYRFTKMMQYDIHFVFVFDGKTPDLKIRERVRRSQLKNQAESKYEKAKEEENLDDMKKYAARTSRLTPEMIADVKELIAALGCPVIQAPGEGEAQAAYMVKKKHAYASLSQDADSLIFGCSLVIKNLTISGRKKLPGKLSYDTVTPELISLSDTLTSLSINLDQLIVIAILTGTDYNYGGVKGIGPKKALKLVQDYGNDFDKIFSEVKWNEHFDYDWKQVFDVIKHTAVTDDYDIAFKEIDEEKVVDILCKKHDFNEERVRKVLETLHTKPRAQKSLGDWI